MERSMVVEGVTIPLSHGGLRICPGCNRPAVDIRKSASPSSLCWKCHRARVAENAGL